MVGAEFACSRAKLGRAKEHLDVIDREIQKWTNSKPCIIHKEANPEAGNYSFWVEIVKDAPLFRLSLITGDFVHNLRSALDNMVWEFSVCHTGPSPPKPTRIQFPIADDPDAFLRERSRISSLSAQVQARIERAQPYNRRHAELPPLLTLVRDFNNLDKHRLLNVVVANITQGRISFTWSDTWLPDEIIPDYDLGPIEGRTKVASLTVRPPHPNMDCTYEGSVVISISHSPGPNGSIRRDLFHVLKLLYDEVDEVVADITM